jgi:hypothetical protein
VTGLYLDKNSNEETIMANAFFLLRTPERHDECLRPVSLALLIYPINALNYHPHHVLSVVDPNLLCSVPLVILMVTARGAGVSNIEICDAIIS